MIKKILFFLSLFFIIAPAAYAQNASIVVINQIRGSEKCCQPGSFDLWTAVSNNDDLKNLPMGWALRYDAISAFNPQLTPTGELGLLLEVTPELASAGAVTYKGLPDGSDWYMAKHAFLAGYAIDERKRLIDTLFSSFKKKFGYYPSFTSGWMVDAWSLSYIRSYYGVVFHQLTKEQYETDSYTLYGGIFNSAYYPSKNYPLLPGTGDDKLDMVVTRQTVSDLIYNYGSPKTVFTSQPNDYLSDTEGKKDTSYFKQLIDDVISQKSPLKFGTVGFENSFNWENYGTEYINQLKYLKSLQKNGMIDVYTPGDFARLFQKQYAANPSFYLTKSFETGKPAGTLWYFGKSYRARLLLKDGRVILDDLRSFAPLSDPYLQNPATADYAYWIIPYLFDGSQQYKLSGEQKKLLKKKDLFGNTVSDVFTSPFGIILGEGAFEVKDLAGGVEIIFTPDKESVKLLPAEIVFNSGNFKFAEPVDKSLEMLFTQGNQTYDFERHFKFSLQKENSGINLGWQKESSFAPLFALEKRENNFYLKPAMPKDISFLNPMFSPDRANLPIDPAKSVFYWNNKDAIAGRNPLRLFILPLNTIGRPTSVKEVRFDAEQNKQLHFLYPKDYSFRVTPWFVDITSAVPLRTSLTVTVDGTVIAQKIPIEFITDCRNNIKDCIRNPRELLSYFSYILKEQFTNFIGQIRKN